MREREGELTLFTDTLCELKTLHIFFRLIYFYISSDSFVLFAGNILHNPRINCLKSWERLSLFEGKSGANERLIKRDFL